MFRDLTDAMQDYVKEIYKLRLEGKRATTSAIAERMGVRPPSVTAMVKRLSALGLAEHAPYRGVELTPAGERVALEVIRHHRLLELYLAQALGLSLDEVHSEADRLEHALSEELEARIDRSLGYPTHDPHGDPIPDADLNVPHTPLRTLGDLEPGEQSTVQRVPDRDRQLLGYLSSLGLMPGASVELVSAAPFGGPLVVKIDGVEAAIAADLAATIGVGHPAA
jgi:DtxR family transcriptional regulator, Mn-dependent transcriptional regulator